MTQRLCLTASNLILNLNILLTCHRFLIHLKMRNTLVLIIVFCLASPLAKTQSVFIPETSFGIKLGGNLSTVSFDPRVEQDLYSGFVGGLVFKHISQKSLGIQVELNYLQAGWSENLESPNYYSRRLNYIQLPTMTHINFGKKKTRFFINLGSYFSYLVSDIETTDLIADEEEKIYYGQDIDHQLDFGFCFGLGLSRNTSIGIIQISSRVNYGFISLFDYSAETPFDKSSNQIAEFTLSYLLMRRSK